VEAMMYERSRLTGIATGDQALFVTRSAFNAAGGFAPIPLMEDVELCSRLKRIGPPACLRERVHTSARRWEKHGVWRTIGLMWWLRAAYFFGTPAEALALQYGYPPAPMLVPAAVAVLAKAPVAGLAKTRLIPALGAKGAARAQRQFTRQILHTARSAALGPVSLWCAPDAQHRFFRAVRRSVDTCLPQPEGDLGHRMGVAFVYHFAGQPPPLTRRSQQSVPLLLVGTDCPALTPGHLQQAAQALQQHDVVLIPAEDGGYVLIGMRRWVPEVFEDITWSTDQVLIQTRQRLRDARASWKELPALWDVDEPADWSRLQSWLHL
jgi:rSAM/selenodomain-associated transferase 1